MAFRRHSIFVCGVNGDRLYTQQREKRRDTERFKNSAGNQLSVVMKM